MSDACLLEFLNGLSRAVQAVDEPHFSVQRFQGSDAYRERAYCYELYHQLRCSLPVEFPYTVHGEIDKRGHRSFGRLVGCQGLNPDFVVHKPGAPENLVVMEVKAVGSAQDAVGGDLDKVRRFVCGAGYRLGILLLFGPGEPPPCPVPSGEIRVFHHSKVGEPPHELYWPRGGADGN